MDIAAEAKHIVGRHIDSGSTTAQFLHALHDLDTTYLDGSVDKPEAEAEQMLDTWEELHDAVFAMAMEAGVRAQDLHVNPPTNTEMFAAHFQAISNKERVQ